MLLKRPPHNCEHAGRRSGGRFGGNEQGATAVEFAFVAPIFLLLVFVIAELAMLFLAEEMVDRAMKDAARLVRTGQVHVSKMDKEEFEKQFCRNLIFLSCTGERLYLDVNSFDSFAEMATTPPVNESGDFEESGNPDFGDANDIVIVRAYYQWPTSPIMGELTLANLPNGHRLISAFAAFRNEPFPASARGAMAAAGAGTGAAR